MPRPALRANPAQTGAITIMVALMLLVLLTLAAIGMSRNSFREVVNSAFARQGAMTSSVADSGLEWALYWVNPLNATSASGDALNLVNLKTTLMANAALGGVAKSITDPTGATNYAVGGSLTAGTTAPTTADPTNVSQGYTIGLTYMGQVDATGNSVAAGVDNGAYYYLLGVRSDAQVIQNNVTFTHAKEAWVIAPLQVQ